MTLDRRAQPAGVDESGSTEAHACAADLADQATADNCLHLVGFGWIGCGGKDGGCERVVAARFQCGSDRQHVGRSSSAGRVHGDDLRSVAGQRAGLVEGDDPDAVECFERGAALHQCTHP